MLFHHSSTNADRYKCIIKFQFYSAEQYADDVTCYDLAMPFAGYGYILGGSSYEINCCGTAAEFTVQYDTTYGDGTLYMQIWRPVSGETYTLVEEYSTKLSKLSHSALGTHWVVFCR